MKTENYSPMSFINAIRTLHRHLGEKPRLTRRERKLLHALDRCYYTKNHESLKSLLWAVFGIIVSTIIVLIFFA